VAVGAVLEHLEGERERYDLILLDLDDGPGSPTTARNRSVYHSRGIAALRTALRWHGTVGVWSADPPPDFERRLREGGLTVQTVQHMPGGGVSHTLYLATTS
jgi:hypothetical protein